MQDLEPVAGTDQQLRSSFGEASHRWLVLAVGLGATLAPLNSTMIAVALPAIDADLGVSVAQTSWLVTIYLVVMVVGLPIGGRIGDLFGQRPMYLLGLGWFGVASAACAFAPSLELLILFRTQQAVAGALIFPNGAAIIRQEIPAGRRGSAFGFVGMTTALAAAIGPPLGGILVHAFDWRAIFWVNVPIVTLALLINVRQLPVRSVDSNRRPPFDRAGSVLFGIALAGFILVPALIRDHRITMAALFAVASIASALTFVWWELRVPHPVVAVRLFFQRTFAAACASITLSNLVFYSTLLAVPLFMDHLRGENEQVVGLTLMALSGMAALFGVVGGRVTDSRGKWLPAVSGAISLLFGVSMLAIAMGGHRLWTLVVALAIMGIGLGVQSAPVQTAVIESAPSSRAGTAAGMYSTSRYFGNVVGTTILAVVFSTHPTPGDSDTFQYLFAGLVVVALAGVIINSHIAPRDE